LLATNLKIITKSTLSYFNKSILKKKFDNFKTLCIYTGQWCHFNVQHQISLRESKTILVIRKWIQRDIQ